MSFLEQQWIDINWLKKASYEETSTSGMPTDKPSNNFLLRFSTSDKCIYSWTGDGTGLNGIWSKGIGGSGGSGITPQVININTKIKTGMLYLADVSTNSIVLDLSNFLSLNSTTSLYECNLNAGDYFEVYIIKGDATTNTVTLSFTGLQASPYTYDLYLEGQKGSDFIFDNNSYFRFIYSGDKTVGFKINSMTGSVPSSETIAVIKPYAGFTLPVGYLYCDGTSKARTDFPDLFNALTFSKTVTLTASSKTVTTSSTSDLYIGEKIEGTNIPIGTTVETIVDGTTFTISNTPTVSGSISMLVIPYGSLNSSYFNLPNLRGKAPFMVDGSANFKAMGVSGGSVSHTNTVEELVPHTHGYSAPVGTEWCSNAFNTNESCCDETWTGYTTGSTGQGKAYSILNPYLSINYIICAK